jgi:hypothetical protein
MTDLSQLLSRVEEAQGPNYELEVDIARALEPERLARNSKPPPYTASLDSALALVERAVPDLTCLDQSFVKGNSPAYDVTMWREGSRFVSSAEHSTPALALLAALLRALISQQEEKA